MKTTLRIVAAACIASGTFFTSAAHADFSGSYNPATKLTIVGQGSAGTVSAPAALTLTGSPTTAGTTDYYFTAPMNGNVSFSWDYVVSNAENPFNDPFSYFYGALASPTVVTLVNAAPNSQSGFVSNFAVTTGQVFGFRVGSNGNVRAATVTIDNFSGPVPEPETYLLMGLGAFALAYARRRQQKNKDQAQAPQMEPVSA